MATSVSVRKHGRLTVRIDRDGHALVVRVLGDLDIASAPALENSLRHVLNEWGTVHSSRSHRRDVHRSHGPASAAVGRGELTRRRGSPSDQREVGRGPPDVEAAARRAATEAADRCLESGRPRRLCGRAGPGCLWPRARRDGLSSLGPGARVQSSTEALGARGPFLLSRESRSAKGCVYPRGTRCLTETLRTTKGGRPNDRPPVPGTRWLLDLAGLPFAHFAAPPYRPHTGFCGAPAR